MTHSPKYRSCWSCWIAQYLEISTFYGNVFYELMAPYSMSSVSNQIRQCSLNVNNDSLRGKHFFLRQQQKRIMRFDLIEIPQYVIFFIVKSLYFNIFDGAGFSFCAKILKLKHIVACKFQGDFERKSEKRNQIDHLLYQTEIWTI